MILRRFVRLPMLLTSVCLSAFVGCSGGSSGPGFTPGPPPPPPGGGSPQIDVQRVFAQVSFASPVALLQAPGDASRWFAVEQSGIVYVFDNDPNVVAADLEVFVDIRGQVTSGGERGLLGMAFHPNFDVNGQVYLSYTRGGAMALESVISRFNVNTGTGNIDPNTESMLITVLQPNSNHNGGNIQFGLDGNLFIGFGDGGGAGDPGLNGQDTTNILGAILRIDVDGAAPYEIPQDNPFSGSPVCVQGFGGADCPEIYAWGFRNPWRFSIDRQTGELWVGDVGQNMWEEIDRVELGLNYGWNEREGAHCFAQTCLMNNEDPITEYGRNAGSSVTGGYVYRGSAIPDLQGFYVFGDFGSGRIWTVPATSAQGTAPDEMIDTPLQISSFAEDEDGEIYALDYGGGGIYRIVDAP